MVDQEVLKRLDEVSERLDELSTLTKESAKSVEATFQIVGKVSANFTLDLSAERPFGVAAGDRVSWVWMDIAYRGTVVGVGPSPSGLNAVVAVDGQVEQRQLPVSWLTRLDDEAA